MTLIGVYLIFIVPAMFVTTSIGEALAFIMVFAVSNDIYAFFAPIVNFIAYINPLKVVGGRYGQSGAWMSSSPLKGGLMVMAISAVSALSQYNALVRVSNVF